MRIGELASRTGVSIRMLRYYDAEGLLAPARTASGYRDYGVADVALVKRIISLGAAGMTLATIRQFLPCAIEGRDAFQPCDELAAILDGQIAGVGARLAQLEESRTLMRQLRDQIETRNR